MTPLSPLMVATRMSLLLLVALTVQIGVVAQLDVFGVQGDVMLMVAIAAGLAAGPDRGATLGFATGLGYDLLLQTPFGLSALTYAIVAYLAGTLQDSVLRAAWWIPVATAATASVAGVILYGVLGTVVGEDLVGWSLVRIAVVVGMLNALVALPVVRAVQWASGADGGVRTRAVYR